MPVPGDNRRVFPLFFMIIDQQLLDDLAAQAKASPRLRMNLNFHHSLDEKCHRFLNAMEPGTVMAIHHHPTKDETVISG